MSMLNGAASYRREDRVAQRVAQRVPVVMPLVDVQVDVDGTVAVRLDREPYATDTPLHREDLQRLLGKLATDLDTPIRVEVCEADGSTFTDIVSRVTRGTSPRTSPASHRLPDQTAGQMSGKTASGRFLPLEDVAVAVVVAHQTASEDGVANLRLPPALLEAHAGGLVLVGQQSGAVVISGLSG
ncbi:hypothetical protein K9U39_20550 [Rhodoblastus acidophilus]|nr:hypothetical protein [Rhodoblastus acidophilus]